ncbi:hypothetical protein HPB50_011463 [Hyalomma asiaticum]|uniref:Uncharacterized protein n=1 Tax=Hyalomma asiaticum TaxID=266040 RepID=A0ACB7RIB5_HYAAI|nr:hypothetical protein HPB50_011463 [Hyalomma asiaticum]
MDQPRPPQANTPAQVHCPRSELTRMPFHPSEHDSDSDVACEAPTDVVMPPLCSAVEDIFLRLDNALETSGHLTDEVIVSNVVLASESDGDSNDSSDDAVGPGCINVDLAGGPEGDTASPGIYSRKGPSSALRGPPGHHGEDVSELCVKPTPPKKQTRLTDMGLMGMMDVRFLVPASGVTLAAI